MARALLVTGLGTCLSLIVETLQLFMSNRVASVADLATNSFGTLAGAAAAGAAWSANERAFARLQRAGWTDAAEFHSLVVMSVLTVVTFLQPFDITLDVSTVVGKAKALIADPWQFTGLRDEGLIFLVSALLSISVNAYLKAMERANAALAGLLITVVCCACLESIQLLITSRMPGLWDTAVFVAGAAAGSWAWQARARLNRRAIRNTAIVIATVIAAVLTMLSPFEVRGTYQSVGWLPLYGYYARTTFQTLSHVLELVLLYFPLGYCLTIRGARDEMRWLPVVLTALTIASPVEYLQGWIVGRFPDASDVAVGLAGACLGAWISHRRVIPNRAFTT